VFKRCLVCETPFPPNEQLEHFPTGERIAFDPQRGRLWAVCRACRRWSLAPIEERWEALEEIEKLARDKGRLLSQTDNIALVRAGTLEIVRVGRAGLTEEAWWRYGRELTERRQRYQKLSIAGAVGAGAVWLGGLAAGGAGFMGMWWMWGGSRDALAAGARWLRFGSTAWRGRDSCLACGHEFRAVPFRERHGLYLLPSAAEGPVELVYRCPQCGAHRNGGLRLTGRDGERVLRRVLAHRHFAGASEGEVKSATRLIEEAGSPEKLARIVVRDGRRLMDIQRTGALGLEIAANEHAEQRLLELELAELEAAWEREEELAAIMDGELTTVPLIEQLRRRVAGQT
jgi:hypothetical protein